MVKIKLLFPRITVKKGSVKKCDLPLGLAYIASYLEKHNHKVECMDISLEGYENEVEKDGKIIFGLSDDRIISKLLKEKFDFIGISCPYSIQFNNVVELINLIKETLNIPIIVGGVHLTFDVTNILKNCKNIDIIVMGEGEQTFLEIANGKSLEDIKGIAYRKKDKIKINEPRELIKNLDDIPFPARHLFNMEKYIKINKPHNHFPKKHKVATIMTSRGCVGHCTFCSSHIFWGSCIRYRSVDNIIQEIKKLIEDYGIQEIQFLDDNLTGNKKRAMELFEKLKELGLVWCTPNGIRIDTVDRDMLVLMKESGCYQVTYALETANKYILHNVIKKPYNLEQARLIIEMTKKLKIGVHTFWIIGFPNETKEQMLNTFNFAKSLKVDGGSFCLANPMVGTELLRICEEENLLKEDFNIILTDYSKSVIRNNSISKKELEDLCDRFNKGINQDLLWRNPIRFLRKYRNLFQRFTKYG